MSDANAEVIEAWNGVLFDKFVRFRHLLTDGLRIHSDAALARIEVSGRRVLDIGCGFGDTTFELARESERAVGVDASRRFVDIAGRRADELGAGNAEFAVKDVQVDDLGGPYDLAFSRFGTMFFMNPVAALRNVRRALERGGEVCTIVWRKREQNPWLHDAEVAVRQFVDENPDSDEPTCGPGPFSMAGADFLTDVLSYAGFERITLERHDADICIGHSLDEAVEFALALGPAGELIRLGGEEAEARRPAIVEALREALGTHDRGAAGVWAPSSTWIARAIAA